MSYQLNDYQEKWLQALESGEYQQTDGELTNGVGFCCLGVACLTAGMTVDEISENKDSWKNELPGQLLESFKLHNTCGACQGGVLIGETHYESLISANDHGASFKEIAAAIRADPEAFFK